MKILFAILVILGSISWVIYYFTKDMPIDNLFDKD